MDKETQTRSEISQTPASIPAAYFSAMQRLFNDTSKRWWAFRPKFFVIWLSSGELSGSYDMIPQQQHTIDSPSSEEKYWR